MIEAQLLYENKYRASLHSIVFPDLKTVQCAAPAFVNHTSLLSLSSSEEALRLAEAQLAFASTTAVHFDSFTSDRGKKLFEKQLAEEQLTATSGGPFNYL